jgi:transposase
LTAKFADALPFYRQEKQFSRIGIELGRSTMCTWAMKVADACDILIDMMQKDILASPMIGVDETPLQVLTGPRKSKSYMWIFRGGSPDKPIIQFQYHPTRSGDVAASFLNGYKGIVQTDGYKGYDFLDKITDIIHVACWTHARRGFKKVTKAAGNKKSSSGNAGTALTYISVNGREEVSHLWSSKMSHTDPFYESPLLFSVIGSRYSKPASIKIYSNIIPTSPLLLSSSSIHFCIRALT